MSSSKSKSLSRTSLWNTVLNADYPMVELHRLLATDDKSRRALALKIVRDPGKVAQAFAKTVVAIGPHVSPDGFHDDFPEPGSETALGELRAANDVAVPLSSRPRTPVETAAVRGLAPGELDLVFLDREIPLPRTPQASTNEGIAEPNVKLIADLLVAAPDGTIGVGEIKIGRDRDLFSALIEVLAGVALISSPAQINRIVGNYVLPPTALAPGPAPKLDAILIAVGGESQDGYLKQLDVLARGFAPELLAEPQIKGVVRQVVGITADLVGDDLELMAKWVERSVA